MGKISIAFASVSLTSFIAYATIAANNPQGSPWYLKVLLWLAIGALVICIVTGIIYLSKLIWGKKLEIDIHDSESKSKISNQGDNYRFEIGFNLKTQQPPVDVARVTLHIQGIKLKSTETPFKLDNAIQSHVSTFESSEDSKITYSLIQQDKYHLSVFAVGKEWQSKEFKLDHSSVIIEVPSALGLTGKVSKVANKSITDNKDSRD